MEGFVDPFPGYTLLLRTIVYGLVPAFTVLQFLRLRRALHVFQLEGYRARRFLAWCRANRGNTLFLTARPAKKPLVMTGRAWRILAVATALTPIAILVPAGIMHIALGGWPADVVTWAVATMLLFVFTPHWLVLTDALLSPVQKWINARYLRLARAKLDDVKPQVIGVTGSFGKTSTKFAIVKLLGPEGVALATPGSFNTPLGVCRTINEQLVRGHRYFVVEMGAYGRGEIAALCRFVKPTVGVLTSIGPAHLERFGSMENIRRAKYEIVESLGPDGVAVMNTDDLVVRSLADSTNAVRVVRYGMDASGGPDVTVSKVELSPSGSELTILDGIAGETIDVRTRLLGRHAIGHVLAGVAVARLAGRPLTDLRAAIESLEAVEHRLQLIEGTGGVTVIDDAYNSNPEGAKAALEVLEAMPGRRKVVVTPGMIELGELQFDANEALGEHAGRVADTVIVVAGVNRDAISGGARRAGGADVITVDTLDEATRLLGELLDRGDVVLFENDLPDQYEGPPSQARSAQVR